MYDSVNIDWPINMTTPDRVDDRGRGGRRAAASAARRSYAYVSRGFVRSQSDAGAARGRAATRATMSSGCGAGPRSGAIRTRRPRARCSGASRSSSRRSRSSTASRCTTAATTRRLWRSRDPSRRWRRSCGPAGSTRRSPATPAPAARTARRGRTACRSCRARNRSWRAASAHDTAALDGRPGGRVAGWRILQLLTAAARRTTRVGGSNRPDSDRGIRGRRRVDRSRAGAGSGAGGGSMSCAPR